MRAEAGSGRTWSCSTPARCGRTPTTGCTATWATCCPVKNAHPGMQIAVGGCLAQKDRAEIVRRAPWVDVVFGTHNIGSLPVLLERARVQRAGAGRDRRVAGGVPVDAAGPARVGLLGLGRPSRVGCNNTCTFCIVPSAARPGGGPAARRRAGRDPGAGRRRRARGDAARAERELLRRGVRRPAAFGKLLRACGAIDGLERVRFTSPHPRDFTDDVIDAMAETPNVMPQLHMPLQSGSDAVLRADAPLLPPGQVPGDPGPGAGGHARRPRSPPTSSWASPARPRRTSPPLSTWCRQARFAGAFTFQYSTRPGTPAATMADQVPPRSCSSATSGWSRWWRRVAGRRTWRWRAAGRGAGRRRARVARTRPRTGCRAAPGTTGWCTSRLPGTERHVRATS